jgi:hypothetical protein
MAGERLLEAYPLTWPLGRARERYRQDSQFKVTLYQASSHLQRELKLLGTKNVVISSNVMTRRDGLPYADARELPIAVARDHERLPLARTRPAIEVHRDARIVGQAHGGAVR